MDFTKLFGQGAEQTANIVKGLVFAVLVGLLIWFLTKKLKEFKQRKVGVSNDQNFNADTIAARVNAVFVEPWLPSGGEMDDLCAAMLELTDTELKAVNDRYKKLYTSDMYSAIDSPICVFCGNRDALLTRMKGLGLGI